MGGGRSWQVLHLILLFCFATFPAGCGGGGGGGGVGSGLFPGSQEVLFADSSTGIQAFAIYTATGELVPLAATADSSLSRFVTGNMVVTKPGTFLLVCDSTGGQIKVFSITAATGALTQVAGSPFPIGGLGGGSITMDSSGHYVYAAYQNGVAGFQFDPTTGALTPLSGSPFSDGSSPNAALADPLENLLYTTNNTVQQGLSVYSLNPSTGALSAVPGSPFATALSTPPYNLAVVPVGGIVYATIPSNNAVLGVVINFLTGDVPNPIPGSPFSAGNLDLFLAIEPTGRFLYTCSQGNGSISGYMISSANDALIPIAGTPFGGSNCDTTVVADPSGQYLYAAYPQGNSITGFQIDPLAGALKQLSGSPFPAKDATLLGVGTVTVQ